MPFFGATVIATKDRSKRGWATVLRSPLFPAVLWLVLAIGVLQLGCSGETAAPVRREVRDGVEYVFNPPHPMEGTVRYQLEEVWSWKQSADDAPDDSAAFGMIADALMGADGKLYLVDNGMNCVHVLSRDGDVVSRLGQPGDGPGDLRRPLSLFWAGSDTLGVMTHRSRVCLYDVVTHAAGLWEMPQDGDSRRFFTMVRGEPSVWALAGQGVRREADGFSFLVFLSAYRPQDGSLVRCFELAYEGWGLPEFELREPVHAPLMHVVVTRDGEIWVAPRDDQYRIEVYDRDGRLVRVIERPYEHVARTKQDMEEIEAGFRSLYPRVSTVHVMEFWNDIERMYAMEDGSVYVESSRGWFASGDSVATEFDVFDRTGAFIRHVVLLGDVDPRVDDLFLLDLNTVLIQRGHDVLFSDVDVAGYAERAAQYEGQPAIVCYRLKLLGLE